MPTSKLAWAASEPALNPPLDPPLDPPSTRPSTRPSTCLPLTHAGALTRCLRLPASLPLSTRRSVTPLVGQVRRVL